MAARICPRCSARVDERRAKMSPFCLSCGAPLGPSSPSATFAGKPASSGSALPWILAGIGIVVLLGFGGIVVVVVAHANAEPDPPAADAAPPALPVVEPPVVAAADAAPSATAAKTAAPPPTRIAVPTPTPTFTTPPRPTTEPSVCALARTARAQGSQSATTLENQCRAAGGIITPTPTATNTVNDPFNTTVPPFPRAKAQAEVDRVAATVSSCKRPEGPFGIGTIRVDFEPDGRTGTLSRPPFASGPVGSCISSRFLAIRIGKFDGSRTSIEKSFIIQE